MKISCAFLICFLFVVALVSSSGKEAWKVSNFSSSILDINYIQLWKWKVFLADLIFLLTFSVALLHLGYSSLAVFPCRVVFVLILLSVLKNLPPFSRLALRCQKIPNHRAVRLPFVLSTHVVKHLLNLVNKKSWLSKISWDNQGNQKRRNILNE